MDSWFETMDFSLEKVLTACSKTSGISNPNINYVNKVLLNWYEEQRSGKDKSGKRKELTTQQISRASITLHCGMTEEQEAEAASDREVYATSAADQGDR